MLKCQPYLRGSLFDSLCFLEASLFAGFGRSSGFLQRQRYQVYGFERFFWSSKICHCFAWTFLGQGLEVCSFVLEQWERSWAHFYARLLWRSRPVGKTNHSQDMKVEHLFCCQNRKRGHVRYDIDPFSSFPGRKESPRGPPKRGSNPWRSVWISTASMWVI